MQTAPILLFPELLPGNMPETCIFSLSSPPCSYLYELTAVRAAPGAGGGAVVGLGRREQDERGAKGGEECQLPSAACQEIFLF